MNTTIQNPVAAVASAMNPAVAAMTRPVMLKDIAEKLGMSLSTVTQYMNPNFPWSGKGVQLVRKTAEEMGYNPNAVRAYCGKKNAVTRGHEAICECGKTYLKKSGSQIRCPECQQKHYKEFKHTYEKIRNGRSMNYYNGNFKTREEEVARMKELRAMGYSNPEIAKAIGRSYKTVWDAIGKQDPELAKQNITMAAHIRAQKNAARKQYVINKPIREYNRRVEQHNQMKAELNKLQTELLTEKPAIVQAAQTKIDFPMIDLHTVQPTALQ